MCVPIGASERAGSRSTHGGPTNNLLRSERGETDRGSPTGSCRPNSRSVSDHTSDSSPETDKNSLSENQKHRFENDLC